MIAPEDICIRGEASIQKSKWTRKLSRLPKWFAGGRGRKIRVFSAFCSRLRAGYVKRVETIRLSSVNDPKKKTAGLRVSTISPVIASSTLPRTKESETVRSNEMGAPESRIAAKAVLTPRHKDLKSRNLDPSCTAHNQTIPRGIRVTGINCERLRAPI